MKNLFSLGLLSLALSPLVIAVETDLEKTTQPVATAVTQSITQAGILSSEGEAVSVLNDEAEKALKSLLANIESLSASARWVGLTSIWACLPSPLPKPILPAPDAWTGKGWRQSRQNLQPKLKCFKTGQPDAF